jgi:hypothetical protein
MTMEIWSFSRIIRNCLFKATSIVTVAGKGLITKKETAESDFSREWFNTC